MLGVKPNPIWDRLVFAKIRRELGFDNLKRTLTGSAPISAELQALHCPLTP